MRGAVKRQRCGFGRAGESADLLKDPSWTSTKADKVAAAVKEWALDRGATVFCHWFQPMGSGGVRHGQAACVQNSMISFGKDGCARKLSHSTISTRRHSREGQNRLGLACLG